MEKDKLSGECDDETVGAVAVDRALRLARGKLELASAPRCSVECEDLVKFVALLHSARSGDGVAAGAILKSCDDEKWFANSTFMDHVDMSTCTRQGCSIDDRGVRAIHIAAAHGKLEMIKLLIRAGANVDAASKSGFTPLHEAAAGGHIDCARALLKRDASLEMATKAGFTAFGMAHACGHASLARILAEEYGADARTRHRVLFPRRKPDAIPNLQSESAHSCLELTNVPPQQFSDRLLRRLARIVGVSAPSHFKKKYGATLL